MNSRTTSQWYAETGESSSDSPDSGDSHPPSVAEFSSEEVWSGQKDLGGVMRGRWISKFTHARSFYKYLGTIIISLTADRKRLLLQDGQNVGRGRGGARARGARGRGQSTAARGRGGSTAPIGGEAARGATRGTRGSAGGRGGMTARERKEAEKRRSKRLSESITPSVLLRSPRTRQQKRAANIRGTESVVATTVAKVPALLPPLRVEGPPVEPGAGGMFFSI